MEDSEQNNGENKKAETAEPASKNIDSKNMKKQILDFSNQLWDAYKLGSDVVIENKNINDIVCCGMGGSGISGDLLASYIEMIGSSDRKNKMPFVYSVKDYSIPRVVGKNSLVFVISYSGNTEEAISCYKDAVRKGASVVILSSGGILERKSKIDNVPFVKLPSGFEPRVALAYTFFPLLKILEKNEIIGGQEDAVKKLMQNLKKPIYDETAKQLSKKLEGRIPLIYSSHLFYPVAYRWKTQFNENAKTMAFCNEFSELNHNEINAFTNLTASFHLIILVDEGQFSRIKKRVNITQDILKKKLPITRLLIKGNCALTKIFSSIHLGDLISYYLSLIYKTDPNGVPVVEELKEKMGAYID